MLECQPENYKISKIEVFAPLQEILKKSSERLCDSEASNCDMRFSKLIVTLSFDNSASHINLHQKNENSENENSDPLQLHFVSSVMIINLRSLKDECSWVNAIPQSIRLYRPPRIQSHESPNCTRFY